jgi:hypothetical protein
MPNFGFLNNFDSGRNEAVPFSDDTDLHEETML